MLARKGYGWIYSIVIAIAVLFGGTDHVKAQTASGYVVGEVVMAGATCNTVGHREMMNVVQREVRGLGSDLIDPMWGEQVRLGNCVVYEGLRPFKIVRIDGPRETVEGPMWELLLEGDRWSVDW